MSLKLQQKISNAAFRRPKEWRFIIESENLCLRMQTEQGNMRFFFNDSGTVRRPNDLGREQMCPVVHVLADGTDRSVPNSIKSCK